MNVRKKGRCRCVHTVMRWEDCGTYHGCECVCKATPSQGSEEGYRGKSSEETFCKYHLGLIDLTCILRPQCSTLDKHSYGPLPTIYRSVLLGDKQGVGRCVYHDD